MKLLVILFFVASFSQLAAQEQTSSDENDDPFEEEGTSERNPMSVVDQQGALQQQQQQPGVGPNSNNFVGGPPNQLMMPPQNQGNRPMMPQQNQGNPPMMPPQNPMGQGNTGGVAPGSSQQNVLGGSAGSPIWPGISVAGAQGAGSSQIQPATGQTPPGFPNGNNNGLPSQPQLPPPGANGSVNSQQLGGAAAPLSMMFGPSSGGQPEITNTQQKPGMFPSDAQDGLSSNNNQFGMRPNSPVPGSSQQYPQFNSASMMGSSGFPTSGMGNYYNPYSQFRPPFMYRPFQQQVSGGFPGRWPPQFGQSNNPFGQAGNTGFNQPSQIFGAGSAGSFGGGNRFPTSGPSGWMNGVGQQGPI